METKIEGIIITKIPYKERDLICKLLLRSGKQISVMFYGGRGGGSKQKSTILEFGHMVKVELQRGSKHRDMFSAKEWSPIWIHEKIRINHHAFYLMCLFLEVVQKISLEANLHDSNDEFDQESTGIFRVLSNGLFYLEDAVAKNQLEVNNHLAIFLGKNMLEQGIFPVLDQCVICGVVLSKMQYPVLSPGHGGFYCHSCNAIENNLPGHIHMKNENENENENDSFVFFNEVYNLKYQDYLKLTLVNEYLVNSLFRFFCYQFQLSVESFKTKSFLF